MESTFHPPGRPSTGRVPLADGGSLPYRVQLHPTAQRRNAAMTVSTLPITPPGVTTQEFLTPRAVRRGIIAGVVGNILEWYDFALFGFFALQIGAHFFPSD